MTPKATGLDRDKNSGPCGPVFRVEQLHRLRDPRVPSLVRCGAFALNSLQKVS